MRHRIALLAALIVGATMLLPAAAQAGTVQNLSAPAVSSTAGGVPHVRYSFSFQVQTALGNTDNITIAADAGTVLPSTATVHDDTTNANFGRSASGGGTSTITVNLCCTDAIAAGDTVTVTLDNVTNPAAGSHTIAVSTSKDTAATSPSFTLVAAQQVTGVTKPTLSSEGGAVPHVRYSFQFTTSSPGGLVQPGTITIAAPSGTTLPGVATLHDVTTGATVGRSGTVTNSGATLTVSLCCTDAIHGGDTVAVTLDDVTNAATGGPYNLSVSTSSDPTPVNSGTYTLTAPSQVTNLTAVSLSSAAAGVKHVTYSFGFTAGSTPTGGLVAPGTIKIAAPAGTVLPGVATIHDATTGATVSRSGALSNSNATLTVSLCCSDAIGAGDILTLTLGDVTNPAAGGHTIDISTSSSPNPVTGPTYTLTAPEQITGLSGVSVSSAAGGIKHVRYSFSFHTSGSTGGLVAPGTITIAAPAGTVLPGDAQLHDDTTGANVTRSGALSNSNATLTVSLCCSDAINPGDSVTVTLGDVTSPPTGGPYTFDVSTSSNPAAVTSPGFSLTAPGSVTPASAVTTATDSHGVVSDSLSFKPSATGTLVPPGTITIGAPAGTVFPAVAHIQDATTGAGFTRSATVSNSGATVTIPLCCSDVLSPGDTVTITLPGVTNPAGALGPFDVFTSSDTVSVQTLPRGTGGPPPVTTPPPPVIGQKATAAPEKGVVLIKAPGKKSFVALTAATSIPVGSTLDTTHGQVGLTFATNASGGTQRGSFSEGAFQVQQSRKNPLTTLAMTGGALNGCNTKLPKGGAPKAKRHRRTLFSSVHGHFATRGRNSSATVRGTKWRTTDTCAGTKTTVLAGTVAVRDLVLRRTVIVKAGHSYLAHAQLKKKRH